MAVVFVTQLNFDVVSLSNNTANQWHSFEKRIAISKNENGEIEP